LLSGRPSDRSLGGQPGHERQTERHANMNSKKLTRRTFLNTSAVTAGLLAASSDGGEAAQPKVVTKAALDRILDAPVLKTGFLKEPVTVASVELLRNGKAYLLRTRSTDGVEALTVPNPSRMAETYPIFLKHILPVFVKKDARKLEALLWEVYRHNSNYKLQGIALWAGVAAMEMALLELMCQTAKRPVADFFGGALKRDIAVYHASGNRGNKPEEEIEHLKELVADSGAKAIKFRL